MSYEDFCRGKHRQIDNITEQIRITDEEVKKLTKTSEAHSKEISAKIEKIDAEKNQNNLKESLEEKIMHTEILLSKEQKE